MTGTTAKAATALPTEQANRASAGAAVELRSLTKTFEGKTVLHRLDLTLEPGQFVAVIGRSGSGKSTLLRLIAGLERPTDGEVRIGGRPLRGVSPETTVMFQDARLLPWKRVVDNVGLGLQGDWRSRAEDRLRQVGLADRASEWPAVLSGGQKQRVALARALVRDPRLLLLDEPLGALDALTRLDMQQLIERLWLGRRFTTLLVTHDVTEAIKLADRIVLIEDGAVAMDIENRLRRPRTTADPAFAELERKVLDRIMGSAYAKEGGHA
ncbi:ATP-binding cassette domain-containing protein [Paenibacillus flagellatus]|uniref:Aliphatic sulfonate ABC transporter ATP-binding protein n=1 Tax=Paenibacillus flagellatus TaxID=2211139 RepID=A0A2V5K465_9BACL|nr:ATP-binding cassette domain-containing protein [Paenibacillus flagellatus]PYI53988.1 aliphatic sulfonate ABC transporter ATP-binding protein [Paenibacillus flagellatus]